MILHSDVTEFKNIYPTADTSGFEKIFRLNDGRKNAFVVLTSKEKFPQIFNKEEYPQELLEKETEGILERYCCFDDAAADDEEILFSAEEEMKQRIRQRKRIQIISNIFLFIFFVFEIFLVLKGAGIV